MNNFYPGKNEFFRSPVGKPYRVSQNNDYNKKVSGWQLSLKNLSPSKVTIFQKEFRPNNPGEINLNRWLNMVFTPFSGFNRFAQNPIGRLGFSNLDNATLTKKRK